MPFQVGKWGVGIVSGKGISGMRVMIEYVVLVTSGRQIV